MSVGQVGTVMCERFSEEVDGVRWYLVRWDGMEGCPGNEVVFLNNGGPRYSPQTPSVRGCIHYGRPKGECSPAFLATEPSNLPW